MAPILADMLRVALGIGGVELLAPGATAADLRIPREGASPPVGIVGGRGPLAQFERDLLRVRPEALILRVDGNGLRFSARTLHPMSRTLGELNVQAILDSISAAPTWESRFAESESLRAALDGPPNHEGRVPCR